MSACTFFGHRVCRDLDRNLLKGAIEELIGKGADRFYVGNQGDFDSMVFHILIELEKVYPHISISVVLAYLPRENSAFDPYEGYSMYPEIEDGLPKFAIERRNKWMIDASDYCLCYINHTWGGAYKFTKRAKSRGLSVVNLGTATL